MPGRSRIIQIGVSSLGVGLLAGAGIGLATTGSASPQTTATTTTTSSTTTTTLGPAPTTTVLTEPSPSVLEFFATPADPTCLSEARRVRTVLTWSSQAATSVSIQADGTTVVAAANPTGRRIIEFDCPTDGTETHDLELTATGTDGTTSSKSTTVTVTGATTATTGDRGGRFSSPDHQG